MAINIRGRVILLGLTLRNGGPCMCWHGGKPTKSSPHCLHGYGNSLPKGSKIVYTCSHVTRMFKFVNASTRQPRNEQEKAK